MSEQKNDPYESVGEKIQAEIDREISPIRVSREDASFDYEYWGARGTHKCYEVLVDGPERGSITISLTPEEIAVIGNVGDTEWGDGLDCPKEFSLRLTVSEIDHDAMTASFDWEAYDFDPAEHEPDPPDPSDYYDGY